MNYNYITIPKKLNYSEFKENNYTITPSKYSSFRIKNKRKYKTLFDLIEESKDTINSIKSEKYLYSEISNIDIYTGKISHQSFFGVNLPNNNPKKIIKDDILISKVRTYRGGVGIVKSEKSNLTSTGAVIVIRKTKDISKEYLFSILKNSFFIEQVLSFENRGMYPRLDNHALKNIYIPIPDHKENKIIKFLTESYLRKVYLIEQKHKNIINIINNELKDNSKNNKFSYVQPKINEVFKNSRMDAGYYSKEIKGLLHRIYDYSKGFKSLTEQDLELIPGPSLELKIIGTRVDSDVYLKNFYRLITPTQISDFGTINYYKFIGTPKKINHIDYGDIIFGESGTGRSAVYLDDEYKTINNAHAHILRPIKDKCSLDKSITIRCILQYYKEIGLIDLMTVGGSGGHLSPSYFDRVPIPNFSKKIQEKISANYFNKQKLYDFDNFKLENYLKYDKDFENKSGIIDLDKASKKIKEFIDRKLIKIFN